MEAAEVEPQSSAMAAEADRAELLGVGVDPLAVHTEYAGDSRGVDEPNRPGSRDRLEQFDDPLSDQVNVVGVEPHASAGSFGSVAAIVCQWVSRTRATWT